MEFENEEQKRFLLQLCSMTEGLTENAVSMFDVGMEIGLDRAGAGALAEDLIVEGWVELRTLSGGISITTDGLRMIDRPGQTDQAPVAKLGTGIVMEQDTVSTVVACLGEIKGIQLAENASYEQIEELMMDVKTLEVQLLSPRPKTAVAREVFRSLALLLADMGQHAVADRITLMITP